MAQAYWEIKIDTATAQEFFTYAGYKIRDAREPFRKVAHRVILPGISFQFMTEGGRTGGWRPLNAEYLKQKAKDGYGGKPILERTGAMKRDLLDPLAFKIHKEWMMYRPGAENRLAEYGYAGYAEVHQTGRDNEDYMPARPWLVITPEDEHDIRDIFIEWLQDLRDANPKRRGTGLFLGNIPTGWSLI